MGDNQNYNNNQYNNDNQNYGQYGNENFQNNNNQQYDYPYNQQYDNQYNQQYNDPYSQQPNQFSNQNSNPYSTKDTSPLTVGNYIVMFLLLAIPIVNIILLFVWAFSGSTNLNKSNYAKAILIMFAILLCIWILFTIAGISIFSSFYRYY